MDDENCEVTRILNAAGKGDRQAAEQLVPLVYGELRKLAAWRLGQEAAAHTLQATALVLELLRPPKGQRDGKRKQTSAVQGPRDC